MLRKAGLVYLLALVPMICISADAPHAISPSFSVCIRDSSKYKFTFEVGIDGIRGTIRRNGRMVNYEIGRYPGPDTFEGNFKQWNALGAKELPSDLSLVTEYVSPASGVERLYGFTADVFYTGVTKHADRIYIKLWSGTKRDASSLLPLVGAALYRCEKGARPIHEGGT